MKNSLFNICLATLVVIVSIPAIAQDTHFSQFSQSPLTVNPALTGFFDGNFRAIMNYRNQWSSVDGYRTMAASMDGSLLKNRWTRGFFGLGLNVVSDKAGEALMNSTQFNLSVSVAKYLSEYNSLSFGLQGGYAQRSIDDGSLTWDTQYNGMHFDASLPSGESQTLAKFSYTDFSTGILWSYGLDEVFRKPRNGFGMKAGMALYHVNNPSYSFYPNSSDNLHSRFVLHGSILFGTPNKPATYIPEFMYERQGKIQEMVVGFGVNYILNENSRYTNFLKGSSIQFNGMYRFSDAVALSAQFKISNYAFGVSYDINVSTLSKAVTGGPEIFLKFTAPNPFTIGQ